MSRIRSVHPGQWTDEDFVALSPLARLLTIALRNEADDNGTFPWKPAGLKMRLFPADSIDMPALLSELESNFQICRYEHEGRTFGAIRNFRDYQRPKKPNCINFLPSELVNYVASEARDRKQISEAVRNQFPTSSEPVGKSHRQMEDGGCNKTLASKSDTYGVGDTRDGLNVVPGGRHAG